MQMNFPFKAMKAAEAAMIFLQCEETERTVLKLVKLLYLAERESFKLRNLPIFGGNYFSLQHGPVPSEAYDLMKNEGLEKDQSQWDRFIPPRDGNTLTYISTKDPIALSDSEVRIIRCVHATHSDKTAWQLREWCHANIPEYEEIKSGRRLIPLGRMAQRVGSDPERVNDEACAAAFFSDVFSS
jgi:uncharacterized phage-associated protein